MGRVGAPAGPLSGDHKLIGAALRAAGDDLYDIVTGIKPD